MSDEKKVRTKQRVRLPKSIFERSRKHGGIRVVNRKQTEINQAEQMHDDDVEMIEAAQNIDIHHASEQELDVKEDDQLVVDLERPVDMRLAVPDIHPLVGQHRHTANNRHCVTVPRKQSSRRSRTRERNVWFPYRNFTEFALHVRSRLVFLKTLDIQLICCLFMCSDLTS